MYAPCPPISFAAALLAGVSLFASPAAAQDAPADSPQESAAVPSAAETQGRVFTPEYFAQFAPRNALDMVARIPGFTIDDGNNGQRGLGQANQNVIVNGARFSSKSDSIRDQLSRISASDVVRIEILDGTALDIPGLSGQVANVVYTSNGTSGQFVWRTGFRPHNTEAQLYGGEVSVTGKTGALGYTFSLSNPNDRFGADGPTLITDADSTVIEEQFSKFSGKYDNPKFSANLSYDFGGETVANLNASYGADFLDQRIPEIATRPDGLVRTRDFFYTEDGPEYEIGGDIEFPLGPGKLKLIGLERFERDNGVSQLVDSFSGGRDTTGFRFADTNAIGERIGRFEYGWNMWQAEWQVSGEAAFNRLNRTSELFELDDNGEFVELDFTAGNGGVTENRYEALLSVSKQLTPKLSLQFTGGGEYSKIEQTGSAANSRSFQRPKGSLSLAWKPRDDFDLSLEFRRRVGQLSFGDFLASVNLQNENQNGGNNGLQPDQSWNIELEVNKRLGEWGSAKLQLRQAWFEDFVDFFPLENGGEARGNIGDATRFHLELNTTLRGDPIGWQGARLDVKALNRWMNLTDPFTGLDRPFSYDLKRLIDVDFRYDVPGSDWAFGSGVSSQTNVAYSRRQEVGRDYEGPTFMNLFVEHKDVFGLKVSATYGNILNARNKFDRTVFDGDRPDAPVLFVETLNRRIGPIFRFSVSGNL
ncbi:TonB-dependent receptor plug domain-containing protein [Qipengyuania sp. RS5-5]|uniref:TonB-dependent receptor plug domain-containing protein n=1 Tax=Parerythrobacter lacustris TaxID=2969984 RepID=A0ABT1XSY5_9SPHN|nr:TonB-dependent receptor plug domain-containing protein [Parerythrobacter lacustris]